MLKKYGIEHIYCINLDRRPDRWELIKKRFDSYALDVQRIPAVEMKDPRVQFLRSLKHGRTIDSDGYVACTFSHLVALQDAYDNGYEKVIMFEDDVRFYRTWLSELDVILEGFKTRAEEYDLIMFEAMGFQNFNKSLEKISGVMLSSSYIITRSSIEKILRFYTESTTFFCIEDYLNIIQLNRKSYLTMPMLCIQTNTESDIQTTGHMASILRWYQNVYLPMYPDYD